jgi:hypothetical protein
MLVKISLTTKQMYSICNVQFRSNEFGDGKQYAEGHR